MVTTPEPLALQPEFLASLKAWTWVDEIPEGGLAGFLLLSPGGSDSSMTPLVEHLGLAAPDEPMPDLGLLLACERDTVELRPTPGAPLLRLPAARDWINFVDAGAPVVLLATAASIAPDAGLSVITDHLLSALLPRTIWMGKTRAR